MHKRIFGLFVFCILFLNYAQADLGNKIESPDGLYSVNPKGVTKISVIGERDKDGLYKVDFHAIHSIYSVIKPGELTASGWWYPGLQQFHSQLYNKYVGLSKCNAWGEGRWSLKYSPLKMNISSKDVSLFSQTSAYVENAPPKKYCVNARMYNDTCERHSCNEWKKTKPETYIVESEKDAFAIFRSIKK